MQIFIEKSQAFEDHVRLFEDQFHYVTRVCRVKVGEKMDFVVENTVRLTGEITDIADTTLYFKLLHKQDYVATLPAVVTLVQGCPKQDKLSDVINMCAQAGLKTLIPVVSSRCIVDYSSGKKDQKLQRWKTVAGEASRQSQRNTVLEVLPVIEFSEFLDQKDEDWDLKLVFWEESRVALKSVLSGFSAQKWPVTVSMVIGPEGGFSRDEVSALEEKGYLSVSLGESILRTEHAGFFALSQILYHFS